MRVVIGGIVGLLCSISLVFAAIGVGVGSGKITIQQKLQPGGMYELPALPVLNTGDESGEYGLSIEYNEQQSQQRPQRDWFHFSPQSFHLDPQQSKTIGITLSVPVNAKPGAYFAYVEAHPVAKGVVGQTSVGIAAAAKLYFTVSPANVLQATFYRVTGIISWYAPWTYVVIAMIAASVLFSALRRLFSFNVQIGFKKK